MNIYENVATQAITSYFYKEPFWKKKIIFNFLLNPFGLHIEDIQDVITQDYLKETIPDFTIITHEKKRIRFEVKINDDPLTDSESDNNTRDAFLICKNYKYKDKIPIKNLLFWEDLFEIIDKLEATKDFGRLDLVREYIKDSIHTLILNSYEAVMFFSPEGIKATYSMAEKITKLCLFFLESKNFSDIKTKNDIFQIGCFFSNWNYFIGLSPSIKKSDYLFSLSVAIPKGKIDLLHKIIEEQGGYIESDGKYYWAYFPLNKEILIKYESEAEMKREFNKNADSVFYKIENIIKKYNLFS